MKIKVTEYNKDKNEHYFEWIENPIENPTLKRCKKIDFFVGCAIEVPTDPYDEIEYDRIAEHIIGKEFDIDENCWSEHHQMWLPNDYHIKTLSK